MRSLTIYFAHAVAGVKELMALPQLTAPPAGAAGGTAAIPAATRSSRRRKGPAFLPSEHDDLPPGVAFMVGLPHWRNGFELSRGCHCTQTLGEHAGPISALDFTEPYGTLVTAGQDDIVRVWDLCDGQQVGTLRGHTGT